VIFDSDILIWLARGSSQAADVVRGAERRAVSVVSYMEMLRGAHDKRDLLNMRNFLRSFGFEILPLTENIGNRAATYLELYCLRVALDVSDALIAATAAESNLPLATGNVKHFSVIQGLDLRPFTPR
jgi:predicted nucleic acid-binding protein